MPGVRAGPASSKQGAAVDGAAGLEVLASGAVLAVDGAVAAFDGAVDGGAVRSAVSDPVDGQRPPGAV